MGYKVQRYGAREFNNNLTTDFDPDFIYWIATQPKLQFQILKGLVGQKCEVLIDKPIVADLEDLFELKKIVSESSLDITVAQPWRYSHLWLASKVPVLEIQQILIERTFTQKREYISPSLDWLPHDFSLLIDLGIDSSNFSYKSFDFGKGINLALLAQLSDGLELRMNIFDASERSSTWKIVLKSGDVRVINFQERTTSIIDSSGRILEHWVQPPNDHPIINVISNFRMLGKSDLFRHFDFYESYFQLGGK
jgi:predicted dehydrogenase